MYLRRFIFKIIFLKMMCANEQAKHQSHI